MPSWRAIHRIGLALSSGDHRLSIEAAAGEPPLESHPSFDGAPSGIGNQMASNQPFLLACLDWEDGGRHLRAATDTSWRMAAEPPKDWAKTTARSGWRAAWAFDGPWAEPWGMPCNAPDDFCRLSTGWSKFTQEQLMQVAQIYQGHTPLGARASVGPDGRLAFCPPQPFPPSPPALPVQRPRLEWYRTRETHAQLVNSWLDLFEARAPHVVLDLGSETFGRVQVRLRSGGPAILAVTTGESLGEVDRYARRNTDIFELHDWDAFTTSPSGFRYVKIVALSRGPEAPADLVMLEPVTVQHIRYDAEIAGSFACSDPKLTALWALSARTLYLCMQNEVWDGIKRDQLPWMGDLYTEALAAYYVLGDATGASGNSARLIRRTLRVLAECGPAAAKPPEAQLYPGLTAIWRQPGSDINGIPSYTMWWVSAMADYMRYTGDISLIWELADALAATLGHIADFVGPDNLWQMRSGWDYVDWSPIPAVERQVFCHLLGYQALTQGAELLETAGGVGEPFRILGGRMAGVAKRFWQERGGFGISHHVNAMAIRSGVLSPEEMGALFAQTLSTDPPATMTPWHRYLDLEAALAVGHVRWGLEYLRRHWGPFLQVGATALWEAMDPAWLGDNPHAVSMVGAAHARYGGYETSLCHGWSSGPAVWLHRAILGVKPAKPGYAALAFEPCLADLEWAEGSVPTPRGRVQVSLHQESGVQVAHLTVPAGTEVHMPQHSRESWRVEITEAPSATA